jgi:hypothetical protein
VVADQPGQQQQRAEAGYHSAAGVLSLVEEIGRLSCLQSLNVLLPLVLQEAAAEQLTAKVQPQLLPRLRVRECVVGVGHLAVHGSKYTAASEAWGMPY